MFNRLIAQKTNPLPNPQKQFIFNCFVRQEYLKDVLSGRILAIEMYNYFGGPLPEFFIHPEGYIYNTNADKKTLEQFLECMQELFMVRTELKSCSPKGPHRNLLLKDENTITQRAKKYFQEISFFPYQIEYPDYYCDTVVDKIFNGQRFLIHRTPDRQYEIYKNEDQLPLQVVYSITGLSRKIFRDKQEYAFVQDVIREFASTKVESFNVKYQEIAWFEQLEPILHAIRKGQPDEIFLAAIDEQIVSLTNKRNREYQIYLFHELKYMLLTSCFRSEYYQEVKDLLRQIQQELHLSQVVHLVFDEAVLEYKAGNAQYALGVFAELSKHADISISFPALFNRLAILLKMNRRAEAKRIFMQEISNIQSPSPKIFPLLYSQIQELTIPEAVAGVGSASIYTVADVRNIPLCEDDLERLLDIFADQYIPELFYNREHELRNFYLKVFGENLKAVRDLQKLKAVYVARGFFGLHHLLRDFLKTEKYTNKIRLSS